MATSPRLPTKRRRTSKRERDPEDKRDRILAAARDLFISKGYGATSTSQIARAAQVSEGLIFLHFESKHGILRRIAADYGKGMAERMREAVSESRDADAAEASVRATFAYVREHGLLQQLTIGPGDPADEAAAFESVRGEVAEMLQQLLEGWKQDGNADFDDAAMTAALVFGVVQQGLLECFAHERGGRESDWIALCTRWIRSALGMR